jgi:hypothetical protein
MLLKPTASAAEVPTHKAINLTATGQLPGFSRANRQCHGSAGLENVMHFRIGKRLPMA